MKLIEFSAQPFGSSFLRFRSLNKISTYEHISKLVLLEHIVERLPQTDIVIDFPGNCNSFFQTIQGSVPSSRSYSKTYQQKSNPLKTDCFCSLHQNPECPNFPKSDIKIDSSRFSNSNFYKTTGLISSKKTHF